MKTFIAVHDFKSVDSRTQVLNILESTAVKDIAEMVQGPEAKCLMNFNNGSESMKMFCHWEAISPAAIIGQLGELNNFFDTECYEMNNVTGLT